MNTRKSATRLSGGYPTLGDLAHYDREARRLRAEFVANGVASLFTAVDRFARRITCALDGRSCGGGHPSRIAP